ncbi:GNAT family N-acetyltransferase, partial [Rhizobium leguminosarum]|uniref:GNAT family N-acetyltransferase n=1 Tax=Rhizobium leguminosarum TaxID=384 RepID=UPI003F95CB60
GRLVAIAGQRMRQTGFIELSGLCTHPDFQGLGIGTLLFRFVAGEGRFSRASRLSGASSVDAAKGTMDGGYLRADLPPSAR